MYKNLATDLEDKNVLFMFINAEIEVAEQLEKMAYDTLKSKFESRFANEQNVRKAEAARAGYDAKNEVETLREEFAMLRKSLTEQNEKIVKSQTVEVPNFDVTNMSWGEIHNIVSGFEE